MSMKRMVTKLALAFAAKKGMQALRGAGGIDGLRNQMAGRTNADTANPQQASSGGLGQILESLGMSGATGSTAATNPMNGSLGTLFGSLASAFGDRSGAQQAGADLDAQFDGNDIQSESEARAIMRAMVHMTRADGAIDADEQAALLNILDEASPDERATLQEALREPVDAKSIAAETPQHARKEVYTAALLLGAPGNAAEALFLRDLADALHLRAGELVDLHDAMGKPHLPAA